MSETHNPYAAPTAAVADVQGSGSAPPPLHPHVRRATQLMWWSFGLGILSMPFELRRQTAGLGLDFAGMLVSGIIGLLITAGILWWFTAKLRAGRNWMRWLLNILFGISVAATPFIWQAYVDASGELLSRPAYLLSTAAQWVLNLVALVLINLGPAREWFAEMKRHAR